MFGSVTITT